MDPQILSYATPRQLEYIEAVEKHGGLRAAAKALGVNNATISHSLAGLKKRAASQGYSPEHDMTRTVPDGFKVKGVSKHLATYSKIRTPGVAFPTSRKQSPKSTDPL